MRTRKASTTAPLGTIHLLSCWRSLRHLTYEMQRNSRSGRTRQGFELGEQFSPVAQLPLPSLRSRASFEVAARWPFRMERKTARFEERILRYVFLLQTADLQEQRSALPVLCL